MNHHAILRRDSAMDSLSDQYRRRFEHSDDASDSGTEASSKAPSFVRFHAVALPFSAKECDSITHQIIDEEKKTKTILTEDDFKPKLSKQKSIFISLSVAVICFAATAIGTIAYGGQWILQNKISSINNDVKKYKKRSLNHVYPESFSVFSSHSERSSHDIPVFLDLDGTESNFVSSALSNCLKLKKESILGKKKMRNVSERQKDFIYTDSLCAFSNKFSQNNKARVFMLVRNPSVRSILSFGQKQNMYSPQFDERTLGLDFRNYVESSLLERDFLTRSILCKENSILTDDDYAAAKFFLENYVTYGVYKDPKSAFLKFMETFDWKFKTNNVKKCVDNVLKKGSTQEDKYTDVGMDMVELYDVLKNANKYDTKLYSYVASRT